MTGSTSSQGSVGTKNVIHGNRGVRQYGVTERRGGLRAKDFSRMC